VWMSQCVAVCCSVLQCVAVCCSVLQCVAGCCRVLQGVAAKSHERMRRVTRVNESCHTAVACRARGPKFYTRGSKFFSQRVTHVRMRHVTHVNESCHRALACRVTLRGRVMSHSCCVQGYFV